ncbi:hypothetical protein [Paenirhodobacter populi]|uniref:Uncharacterized protein n=1 Tax=Paenirhodobacter populi TaxID=2306993 RepID=A0A443IZN5_9RHOB|nr:hypothetical protein [Sinirhodobacter populi]RWR13798.1 hypothetical protein D2T33_05210 [Sinirhodobacter populi]
MSTDTKTNHFNRAKHAYHVMNEAGKTDTVIGGRVSRMDGRVWFAEDEAHTVIDDDGHGLTFAGGHALVLDHGHVVHLGGLEYAAVFPIGLTKRPPMTAQ